MTKYDWRLEDVWDNGEFLTGATVVYLVDGEESHRETFVGTTEDPPGYTALDLAASAANAWYDHMTSGGYERRRSGW